MISYPMLIGLFYAFMWYSNGLLYPAMLLVIAASLLVHELGHALAMRLCGVGVEEIRLGIGQALVEKESRSGVKWSLGPFLFGAYVRPTAGYRGDSIEYASVPRQVFISAAGVLVNLLVAAVLGVGITLFTVPGAVSEIVSIMLHSPFKLQSATAGMLLHGNGGSIGQFILNGAVYGFVLNLLLIFINLIPLKMLDGGKIFQLLVLDRWRGATAERWKEYYDKGSLYALIALFVYVMFF